MEKQKTFSSSHELSKQLHEHETKGLFNADVSYRMNKKIEKEMEDFDIEQKQKMAKSIEGFKKIYITS